VLNGFLCHHLAHITSSGRIAYHSRTTTDQSDRFVSRHLQTFHQAQCHKMPYMQTVCSRVKPDVKSRFSIIDQIFNFFFVGYLGDQTTGN